MFYGNIDKMCVVRCQINPENTHQVYIEDIENMGLGKPLLANLVGIQLHFYKCLPHYY